MYMAYCQPEHVECFTDCKAPACLSQQGHSAAVCSLVPQLRECGSSRCVGGARARNAPHLSHDRPGHYDVMYRTIPWCSSWSTPLWRAVLQDAHFRCSVVHHILLARPIHKGHVVHSWLCTTHTPAAHPLPELLAAP